MRSIAFKCRRRLRSALSQRQAASAIEYALVAGLIAVVIVGAVTSVGVNLGANFYARIASALT